MFFSFCTVYQYLFIHSSDKLQRLVYHLLRVQQWRPQTMAATTMMVTTHDDQLGEIYSTMLNEFTCRFGVSFSRFHCCDRQGHGLCLLWLSWYRPFTTGETDLPPQAAYDELRHQHSQTSLLLQQELGRDVLGQSRNTWTWHPYYLPTHADDQHVLAKKVTI